MQCFMTFYRRNLPHWQPDGKSIFITWRLCGSLPASLPKKTSLPRIGRATRKRGANEQSPGKEFLRLDSFLDSAKSGPLWLSDPKIAACAEYTILHGAELGRYDLHAYVVMPNHVHVLLQPRSPLAKITNAVKGIAARDANVILHRAGRLFWQDESFDHWIRNSAEFERIRHYIEWNPVRAGLVARPGDWKWSSAGSPSFKREGMPLSTEK